MQFSILGPIRVTTDEGPLDLGGPRQRTVLAVLLLRFGRQVQTEALIDLVWGQEPPTSARTTLHSYISRLRRLLGTDRIEGRAGGYALLADTDEVDMAMFERLVGQARASVDHDAPAAVRAYERADHLWRGPALADLRDQVALRADAVRLDDLRITAIEERVQAELSLGHHAELVPQLELLVEGHPGREALWRHRMLALYRSGRQAEALQAYHRLRAELDDELGIGPSPETDRLQRRILEQDASLDLVGEPLRGYRLLHPIGRGPMGVVHRAVQPQVDRPVAVKVIDARLADDPAYIRRFETRARRIARLEHPHIATIHDYWREPGAAYIVTPLFEGGSLADALAGDALGLPVMDLVEQVASALAFAHRQGVVHGNLHAGNVLLDGDGNAYVTDFAARLHGLVGDATRSGQLSHVAPEVAGGEPATPLSDVFSLGRLLSALAVKLADQRLLELGQRATAPDPTTRHRAVDDLLAELAGISDAGRTTAPGPFPVAPDRNPYKGLQAFGREDADDFFGRDAVVGRVLEQLGAGCRFLAIVGPSGCGKSSLVRAGLLPTLADGTLEGSDAWFVADIVPTEHPFTTLNEAIRSIATSAGWEPLSPVDHDLRRTLGEALRDTDAPVLLVVDQFEELFTLVEEDVRDAFIATLVDALADDGGQLRVVITLRADHYDRPLEHPALAELTVAGTLGVPPLSPSELGEAIARPAEGVGVTVDPGLVARLTADVVSDPAALPHLQYALTEMFDRHHDGPMGLGVYDEVQGLGGAITHRAEELWETLSAGARTVAPEVFLRLVQMGDTAPVRRRAAREELLSSSSDRDAVEALLVAFGDARLVSFDRDPVTRAPTVEVAHEALLVGWPRLRTWIDHAREDLLVHRQLAGAAVEWHDAGRDDSFLARGSRLARFTEWYDDATAVLSTSEQDFLSASVRTRDEAVAAEAARRERERDLERRAARRLRVTVATLAIAALVAAATTIFALAQRDEARDQARLATARGLAASALAAAETDSQRGLALALEAVDLTLSRGEGVVPEAEAALYQSTTRPRLVARIDGIGGNVALHPSGDLLVTEGPENTGLVDVRALSTGDVRRSFVGHAGTGQERDLNAVAFSPDGSVMATAGDDGLLRLWGPVWDEDLDQPLFTVGASTDQVWGPAFDPSGALVAAAWRTEGAVRVVDVADGEVVLEVAVPTPLDLAFGPDGSEFAVVSGDAGVHVLRTDDGSERIRFGDDGAGPPNALAWSPDGRWIASTTGPDVHVWDAATGRLRARGSAGSFALDVAWSPDSSALVAGDISGRVTVWGAAEDGSELSERHVFLDPQGPVSGVAFTGDGRRVVAGAEGGPDTAATWVWDLPSGGLAELLALPGPGAPPRVGAAFSSEGELLVASQVDGTLTRWDVGTLTSSGRPTEQTPFDAGGLTALLDVAVSPDGRHAAWHGERSAHVWDLEVRRALHDHWTFGSVNAIEWSPDGSHLAVAESGRVTILGIDGEEEGRLRIVGEDGGVEVDFRPTIAFSPGGDLLAVGGFRDSDTAERRVELWDWREEERLLVFATTANGWLPAFAPGGDRLYVAGGEAVEVLDVATGELVGAFETAGGVSSGIAAHVDGATVVTGAPSGRVTVWDATTGRRRFDLTGLTGVVQRISVSADGRRLVAVDDGGNVRVWTLDIAELVASAREALLP